MADISYNGTSWICKDAANPGGFTLAAAGGGGIPEGAYVLSNGENLINTMGKILYAPAGVSVTHDGTYTETGCTLIGEDTTAKITVTASLLGFNIVQNITVEYDASGGFTNPAIVVTHLHDLIVDGCDFRYTIDPAVSTKAFIGVPLTGVITVENVVIQNCTFYFRGSSAFNMAILLKNFTSGTDFTNVTVLNCKTVLTVNIAHTSTDPVCYFVNISGKLVMDNFVFGTSTIYHSSLFVIRLDVLVNTFDIKNVLGGGMNIAGSVTSGIIENFQARLNTSSTGKLYFFGSSVTKIKVSNVRLTQLSITATTDCYFENCQFNGLVGAVGATRSEVKTYGVTFINCGFQDVSTAGSSSYSIRHQTFVNCWFDYIMGDTTYSTNQQFISCVFKIGSSGMDLGVGSGGSLISCTVDQAVTTSTYTFSIGGKDWFINNLRFRQARTNLRLENTFSGIIDGVTRAAAPVSTGGYFNTRYLTAGTQLKNFAEGSFYKWESVVVASYLLADAGVTGLHIENCHIPFVDAKEIVVSSSKFINCTFSVILAAAGTFDMGAAGASNNYFENVTISPTASHLLVVDLLGASHEIDGLKSTDAGTSLTINCTTPLISRLAWLGAVSMAVAAGRSCLINNNIALTLGLTGGDASADVEIADTKVGGNVTLAVTAGSYLFNDNYCGGWYKLHGMSSSLNAVIGGNDITGLMEIGVPSGSVIFDHNIVGGVVGVAHNLTSADIVMTNNQFAANMDITVGTSHIIFSNNNAPNSIITIQPDGGVPVLIASNNKIGASFSIDNTVLGAVTGNVILALSITGGAGVTQTGNVFNV